MTTEEEFLIEMKNFFENIDKLKTDLEQEIRRVELERNDLLHELELGNLNAVEITKVAVDLKKVRKERRIIKNDIERIRLIKNFTDKYNNKFIENEINILLKELKRLKKRQENRKYEPRILKNIEIGEKHE